MKDEGWRMEDGGWRMEDGGWRIATRQSRFSTGWQMTWEGRPSRGWLGCPNCVVRPTASASAPATRNWHFPRDGPAGTVDVARLKRVAAEFPDRSHRASFDAGNRKPLGFFLTKLRGVWENEELPSIASVLRRCSV